jgi:hypothetical protein
MTTLSVLSVVAATVTVLVYVVLFAFAGRGTSLAMSASGRAGVRALTRTMAVINGVLAAVQCVLGIVLQGSWWQAVSWLCLPAMLVVWWRWGRSVREVKRLNGC